MYPGLFAHSSTNAQYAQLSYSFKQVDDDTIDGDDTVDGDIGDDVEVGGNVLAIRGSEHSPHCAHTSFA